MIEPKWKVIGVLPHEDFTLELFYKHNKVKIFDVRPLLSKPLYQKLNDLSFFMTAKCNGETVVWEEECDIAPEYLYEHSKNKR